MSDDHDVLRVERSAAAAWPASRTETVAGWLLRHTPGVPRRRNNSALPPAPDRHPDRTLDAVEAFYRAAGLPVTVQVSPAERHSALDAALAARGYRREAPTLVLTAPAAGVAAAAAPAVAGEAEPVRPVVIDAAASPGWLAAYQALNDPAGTTAVAGGVLARVPAPAAFARVAADGRDVAIGLFVAGGEWAGVFCMATDPRYRRRGLALTVLAAGARWAAARGCAGLYLQVEQDNIAARYLYRRAAFTYSHGYHYRVSDTQGTRHYAE
jgi:ribosomal protein S18 acetylase RimI-like enzyme